MRGSMAIAILLFLSLSSIVNAAPADWDDCVAFEVDGKIAACTQIIDDPGETQRSRAKAYNYRGNGWRQKGELDHAVADYDEAIRLNPGYAFPHNGRGLVWRAKGNLDAAIVEFSKAISLDPLYPKTYNNRGDAWRYKGKLDRAIADLDQAIILEPKYILAYFNRGLTWRAKGELDLATRDFSTAISLDAKYAFAYFNRGLTWRAQSRLDSAIADFDEAIRLDPHIEGAYFNRGLINLYAEGPGGSLADINRASELDPGNPYFALWTDIVRQRMGLPSPLLQTASKFGVTIWPAPVLRLFLGQLSTSALLAAAYEPKGQRAESWICEANFYSGTMALREDRVGDAKILYQLAADRCPQISIEWYAAHAELKQFRQ